MKERAGWVPVHQRFMCWGGSRGRARDRQSQFGVVFFLYFWCVFFFFCRNDPEGYSEPQVKGGASWESCSLPGRATTTRSTCVFRQKEKKKQPTFHPLAIPNCVSIRWHMELASAPSPPPSHPAGTCSSLMPPTPTPLLSLSSATRPLIGTTATSPRRR